MRQGKKLEIKGVLLGGLKEGLRLSAAVSRADGYVVIVTKTENGKLGGG